LYETLAGCPGAAGGQNDTGSLRAGPSAAPSRAPAVSAKPEQGCHLLGPWLWRRLWNVGAAVVGPAGSSACSDRESPSRVFATVRRRCHPNGQLLLKPLIGIVYENLGHSIAACADAFSVGKNKQIRKEPAEGV